MASQHLRYHYKAEDDKLVARIGNQLEELWIAEIQACENSFLNGGFKKPYEEGLGEYIAEILGLEVTWLTLIIACDQNKSDERHERNVQIRCLQIVSGRELLLLRESAIVLRDLAIARSLSSLPVILFQKKWEQDDLELVKHISIGDIEVDFEPIDT